MERAAQAFYDALQAASDPLYGSYVSGSRRFGLTFVTLHGTFDFLAAMRAALEAIREPSSVAVDDLSGRGALAPNDRDL